MSRRLFSTMLHLWASKSMPGRPSLPGDRVYPRGGRSRSTTLATSPTLSGAPFVFVGVASVHHMYG